MQQEYLLTNRHGGYSSSTSELGNTRKYHGLLVAGLPGLQRFCIVNRLEEKINYLGSESYLSTNVYKGEVVSPQGHKWLSAFNLGQEVTWKYQIGDASVERKLHLHSQKNLITVSYKINTTSDLVLTILPLLTKRSIHELRTFEKHEDLGYRISERDEKVTIHFDVGELQFASHAFNFQAQPLVYKDFFYKQEAERGYPAMEDLVTVGEWQAVFGAGEHEVKLVMEYKNYADVQSGKMQTFNLPEPKSDGTPLENILQRQATQFIFAEGPQSGIVAGYHWFDEWGRDTFIALKGLLIDIGNLELATTVCKRWISLFRDGFLPNRPFAADYNSLDSALWFAVRFWELQQLAPDPVLAQTVVDKLEEVIAAYQAGSRGVKVQENGLLWDGNSDKALTWMDAKVEGKPVLDRSGFAVEIQALWYNLLRITLELKYSLHDQTFITEYRDLATKVKRNFEQLFWIDSKGYLADCLKANSRDENMRANQIIAFYLPFQLLGKRNVKRALTILDHELLTAVGPYTLSPKATGFHPHYRGDQATRDMAYHQGTIWPFLLGMYEVAYLRAYSYSKVAKQKVLADIADFFAVLEKQNLAYVPEIFEAESLRADGCISQAWSVGCLLEVYAELEK